MHRRVFAVFPQVPNEGVVAGDIALLIEADAAEDGVELVRAQRLGNCRRLEFPGYLDRQQIVTRVSQNRFAVAENDRWAEPLEENFSRVLSQNLSILLQTDRIVAYPWVRSQQPTYQVHVEVLRFEANAEQLVELWGRWSIIEGTNKTVSVKETYLTHPTRDKSTEASVAALSETVADLSREIADAIRAIGGGKGS